MIMWKNFLLIVTKFAKKTIYCVNYMLIKLKRKEKPILQIRNIELWKCAALAALDLIIMKIIIGCS